MKFVAFDIEIKNRIPMKGEPEDPKHTYCKGWSDHEGMGISFLGAYKSWTKETLFYDEHNILEFINLIEEADIVTGFNIHKFDTSVLKATLTRLGHPEKTGMSGKCYDIFHDVKKSLGNFYPKGWKLDEITKSTLGEGKNGDGANAPILYQEGKIAELINYLSVDVKLEAKLFEYIVKNKACSTFGDTRGAPHHVKLTGITELLEKMGLE